MLWTSTRVHNVRSSALRLRVYLLSCSEDCHDCAAWHTIPGLATASLRMTSCAILSYCTSHGFAVECFMPKRLKHLRISKQEQALSHPLGKT